MLIKAEHRERFRAFGREMVRTRDYDPNYFVVKGVCMARSYSEAQTFRYCAVFNGFYHFESADRFFADRSLDPVSMPMGVSRRGFRGNRKVLDYVSDLEQLWPRLRAQRNNEQNGWRACYDLILACVRGAGPWSAFYMTDLLKVVLGFRVTSPDFGDLGSSPNQTGPTAGLAFLTGIPLGELMGNGPLHRRIYVEVADIFDGMEQMESVLCNYLSLHKGRYYVGRDIDRQMPMLKPQMIDHWAARSAFFPATHLGERGGWTGIRKELMGRFP